MCKEYKHLYAPTEVILDQDGMELIVENLCGTVS